MNENYCGTDSKVKTLIMLLDDLDAALADLRESLLNQPATPTSTPSAPLPWAPAARLERELSRLGSAVGQVQELAAVTRKVVSAIR